MHKLEDRVSQKGCRQLTGEPGAVSSVEEEGNDKRVVKLLEMEVPHFITDRISSLHL